MSASPIFRLDAFGRSLFYTPGYVVAVESARANAFAATLDSAAVTGLAEKLRQHARQAQIAWQEHLRRPFYPLCLTLYLNNECNLACGYCYSESTPPGRSAARLDPASVRAAARLVARNCAEQNRPLIAVFHGGGEPTLHQRQVQLFLNIIDQAAAADGIQAFKYIATNGVMPAQKAAWIARQFDLVGLSCDGPADIQQVNRPLRNGQTSTHFVERAAEIFHKARRPFRVRVTIPPDSMRRQAEIAKYVCDQLQPTEIEVEPVYRGGRSSQTSIFAVEQAILFVDEFLKAREIARQYGILWHTSGSRMNEIHGPYCNIFRNVLHLTPGGVATACFKAVDAPQAHQRGVVIGNLNHVTGEFDIDNDQVIKLQQAMEQEPALCLSCINRFHCVRNCPDLCPVDQSAVLDGLTFRCLAQKLLAEKLLLESAASLSTDNSDGICGRDLAHQGFFL